MNILVTGASGMLGTAIVENFAKYFNVYATGRSKYKDSPVPYKQFDLSEKDYGELISWSNPNIIIHSGALTNGNYCNENPTDAFNINGVSVKKFIDATENNVRIIYISTDAVFPSNLQQAKENDYTYPESIYGKSKELGEFFLINFSRNYTIVRTTIVGLNTNKSKPGFVEWILNSALKKENIGLFDDVVFNPISIWDLTNELKHIIQNPAKTSEILHIAGNTYCTKYEFGLKLLGALSIETKCVEKSTITSFSHRAKRSTDQTLDSSYYQKQYKRTLPLLENTINTLKDHYNEQY